MSTNLQAFVHTLRFEAQDTISVDLRPVAGGSFPPSRRARTSICTCPTAWCAATR